VELYYNVAVTPWCQITPDLQVISPFRDRVDSSLTFGLRAKIDF
jgi:porin